MRSFENTLGEIAAAAKRGRVEVLCLGNPLRGDDAFGYLVYRKLKERGIDAVYAQAPENIVGVVARRRPDLLVVVDAILSSKEIVALKLDELEDESIVTTHTIPLRTLIEVAGIDPARVVVIGASAHNLRLGEPPSPPIVKAAETVANLLTKALTSQI